MSTFVERRLPERAFPLVRINKREAKPRQRGLTEIRGPYYSVMGARYLTGLLETVDEHVDGVKYAGGSFALMPRERVQELNDLAHRYNLFVDHSQIVQLECLRAGIWGTNPVSRHVAPYLYFSVAR